MDVYKGSYMIEDRSEGWISLFGAILRHVIEFEACCTSYESNYHSGVCCVSSMNTAAEESNYIVLEMVAQAQLSHWRLKRVWSVFWSLLRIFWCQASTDWRTRCQMSQQCRFTCTKHCIRTLHSIWWAVCWCQLVSWSKQWWLINGTLPFHVGNISVRTLTGTITTCLQKN